MAIDTRNRSGSRSEGQFSQSHHVVHDAMAGNRRITWISGRIPQDENDWNLLKTAGLRTILNFSNWNLKRRAGFEIINVQSNITSLIAPMSDSEHHLVSDFLDIISLAKSSTEMYICGGPSHTSALCTILSRRVGLKISEEVVPVENYAHLVNKYS